jgi:hypothetical protein
MTLGFSISLGQESLPSLFRMIIDVMVRFTVEGFCKTGSPSQPTVQYITPLVFDLPQMSIFSNKDVKQDSLSALCQHYITPLVFDLPQMCV